MAKNRKDNGDKPESNTGNGDDSADNFGLPDIEYKPLEREQEKTENETVSKSETYQESTTKVVNNDGGSDYDDDEEPSSKAPLFITLIIIVVVVVAAGLVWKYWYVPMKAKQELELAQKKADEAKVKEQARLAAERAAAEQKRLDSIAAANVKPAIGTIETLTAPTRRFYVVVTSDIDDDLVLDFAKKLSAKGVSTKMIPAFGTSKYFRLAIADFDTYNEAQTSADGSKGEYGAGVWVIRY